MTQRFTSFSAKALHCSLTRLLDSPRPDSRRLWIAYSGGLDSSALLHAAASLLKTKAYSPVASELRAIHIDHGLQAQSARWATHCRNQCNQLGIPCSVRHLRLRRQSGESLEAVARNARYEVFAELLQTGDALATAQHRDDQAETLLLALLRGSGVHGLASMPARASLGAGWLLRPLLQFGRAELEAYAQRVGLCWLEDSSNADLRFDRNRLRHQILSPMRSRWPALDVTFARSAAHCAEAAWLLDGFADELLVACNGTRAGTLSIQALTGLPDARRRLVLRRWLAREGFQLPNSDRLRSIVDTLMFAAADRVPLVAWRGCEVRRYRDDLYALAPLPPPPDANLPLNPNLPLVLPGSLGRLYLPHGFDAEGALSVCFRQPSLSCRILSGAGSAHARSLKYLFQQAGVPAWIRPYVPLVMIDGELAAVTGLSLCDGRLAGVIWEGHPWERFGFLRGERSTSAIAAGAFGQSP